MARPQREEAMPVPARGQVAAHFLEGHLGIGLQEPAGSRLDCTTPVEDAGATLTADRGPRRCEEVEPAVGADGVFGARRNVAPEAERLGALSNNIGDPVLELALAAEPVRQLGGA